MAESESGADKTEDPSQKRLDEARKKGQLPRSKELTNFATTLGGSVAVVATGGSLAAHMAGIMQNSLKIEPGLLGNPESMASLLGAAGKSGVAVLLPILGALFGLGMLASVILGGWNFSPEALTPDFSRLSPVAGLKRAFGTHGFTELGKALLKCLVVGGVCAAIVAWQFRDVMSLGHMTPLAAIDRGAGLLGGCFVWLCASLGIIAAVDVPLVLYQYKSSLKMTRQEVKDEGKESEGPPQVKQRIRRMQQTMARRRMMHKVPSADVVVVNPTHFAVALKYDPQNMAAPRVLAKGVDLIAANIRRIAEEHRVPVFESPKLARALHKYTDLNEEIPAGLYVAVAQVLSYIFKVRTLNPTAAARMAKPVPTVGDEYLDV
jgi:flagellar biosynthetic protein FlhB